jgi:hypothetical protein
MKSSQILKKARKLIESGEQGHICNAIYYASGDEVVKRLHILDFISKSLGGHYTLARWLAANVDPEVFDHTNYAKRICQTRLNWIDHMIELYKAKGD